jgi:cyclopropane fatty-acyl-phospholipid synthase-like methyltransferase
LAKERGATVLGITLSGQQVAQANGHAKRRGLSHQVSFEVRDFSATGLPAESFSVVWAIESVCHALDKAAFFQEAYRLLKPGGRLIMSDFFRAVSFSDVNAEAIYRQWLEGWAVPDLLTAPSARSWPTQQASVTYP